MLDSYPAVAAGNGIVIPQLMFVIIVVIMTLPLGAVVIKLNSN